MSETALQGLWNIAVLPQRSRPLVPGSSSGFPQHRTWDSPRWFGGWHPWGPFSQCRGQNEQVSGFRMGRHWDIQAPYSPLNCCSYVFNISSCVCFWMACDLLLCLSTLVTPPQTLPRQNHTIQNSRIPEQPPLYETYVYLKDPLNGRAA